jgi:predicted RNase H-like nuclease (RuvC/YqgF family)
MVNRMSTEAAGLRDALGEAETALRTELSSLKKPVKKIEHALAKKGKITPIQKNTLRDFIRDPFRVAEQEKGVKALVSTLGSARRNAEKEGIEKELDVDSVMGRLEGEVASLRSLFLEKKRELEGNEKSLDDLSKVVSTKEGIEREIKRMSEDTGQLEEELRIVRSRISGIDQQVRDGVKELQALILEESQKRVIIRM